MKKSKLIFIADLSKDGIKQENILFIKISRQLSKFHWRVSIDVRTEWLGKGKEEDVKHKNI